MTTKPTAAEGRPTVQEVDASSSVRKPIICPARGRRLAPALRQRLVDELPACPGDVLRGTVHPDSTPSLRNALSSGRTITSSVVWVTPTGCPGMPDATAS